MKINESTIGVNAGGTASPCRGPANLLHPRYRGGGFGGPRLRIRSDQRVEHDPDPNSRRLRDRDRTLERVIRYL